MDFSLDNQIKLMNTKIIVWLQAGYDIPKIVPSCKQIWNIINVQAQVHSRHLHSKSPASI